VAPKTAAASRPSTSPFRGRGALFVVVGLVAGAIAIGLVIASQVGSDGGSKTQASVTKAVGAAETAALFRGIPQSGNVLGRPGAPVTLVEFADLQCPYCAVYAVDVLPTIVREYVRTGKIKLEFRGMAFVGDDSVTALRTVVAAGLQNRLWNVLDLLYRNQGEENSGWVTEDLLRSIGGSVPGLDGTKMLDARDSTAVADRIAEDASVAEADGINATPSFLVRTIGGATEPLQVSALEPAAFRSALDALGG
jgi:protein-disulfide isomerase